MSKMKSETDETLVAMYANGNNDAFDALLERYKQTIHSYIYFSVRDYDLTEDLFQETFMKVITTIRPLQGVDYAYRAQPHHRSLPPGAQREHHLERRGSRGSFQRYALQRQDDRGNVGQQTGVRRRQEDDPLFTC